MKAKRILSVIIALAMIIGTMGTVAFAEDVTLERSYISTDTTYDLANTDTLTVTDQVKVQSGATLTINGGNITVSNFSKDWVFYAGGGNIVFNNVNFTASSLSKYLLMADYGNSITFNNSTITLTDAEALFYNAANKGILNLNNTTVYLPSGCQRVALGTNPVVNLTNESLIDADGLSNHAFRNVDITVENSTIDVNGCETGIKNTDGSNVTVTGNSTITVAGATGTDEAITLSDGSKMYATSNANITVDDDAYEGFDVVVATVSGTPYTDLQKAIDAAETGDTITLLDDNTGAGVKINKSIIIDFDGHTYTVNSAVGSEGTETLGFQVLAGSNATPYDVTFKNGKIEVVEEPVDGSNEIKVVIMNYSNLTLENMVIDGTGNSDMICAFATNNGTATLKGETNVLVNDGVYAAVDCDGSQGDYGAASLVIETTGTIDGNVEIYGTEAATEIKSGTFKGTVTVDSSAASAVTISGGSFVNDVKEFVAEGSTVTISGESYTAPAAWNGETIASPEDLKAFRDAVNAGDEFKDKTVTLTADIDLENEEWTPISSFKGTFDGGNHTIKNLKISDTIVSNVGLFGVINSPAIVKNVTVENPYIVGCAYVGGIVGCANTGTVENCHVTGEIDIEGNYMVGGITGQGYAKISNCSVIGDADWDYNYIGAAYLEDNLEGDNVGGIIGHKAESSTSVISGCRVENVTIKGTRKIGGIVGITFVRNSVANCSVKNVTVGTNATATYAGSNANSMGVGGIVGLYQDDSGKTGMLTENTVENITLVDDNKVGASMGYLTGGYRGTEASELPATMTVAANLVSGTNTGATNDFANNPDGVYPTWDNNTDTGCYGDKTVGMMRFLFAFNITDAIEVKETGIKYIDASAINSAIANSGLATVSGEAKAFYGDITGVPADKEGNQYYAIAYAKTASGKTYWSDPISCKVDFTQFFADYTGGAQ